MCRHRWELFFLGIFKIKYMSELRHKPTASQYEAIQVEFSSWEYR